jgi:hypothetical protein
MARFQGMSDEDKLNDIEILNRALFFENRGVWAYGFAADKLSNTEVGKNRARAWLAEPRRSRETSRYAQKCN